jgi:hypothetical protein
MEKRRFDLEKKKSARYKVARTWSEKRLESRRNDTIQMKPWDV